MGLPLDAAAEGGGAPVGLSAPQPAMNGVSDCTMSSELDAAAHRTC